MTPTDWSQWLDLASERLGGAVLAANDEFFAPKESLLKPGKPVFREGAYTERGKWMDGWETRRRREAGHDWCIVRLGLQGVPRGVLVDCTHFRGNHPEACSLEGASLTGHPSVAELAAGAARWCELLPRSPLASDAENRFPILQELPEGEGPCTHLRFNIYPDGGVARLRVHGEVVPDRERLLHAARVGWEVDLAAAELGGLVIDASDMFFGSRHHLILPGPPLGMHDGWETRRRRGPGHDWALLRLGARGRVERVEVDTSHFKGNAPESCSLEVADAPGLGSAGPAAAAQLEAAPWRELLPRTRLQPHTRHLFAAELAPAGPATHARFHLYPDGGVGRLRLFGRLA
ncbi:MAG TPA: allantoicase [Thermoanaerobaculia bacterium]|nr:allantoicase [Thermoanaerobaculia bacterium]